MTWQRRTERRQASAERHSPAARLVRADAAPERHEVDRLLIRDLVLNFRIGVHAHERLAHQRVRLNVEVEVRRPPVPIADDIANVLSYEDLIGGIKELAAGAHINLVETLAERVAGLCLASGQAAKARVRVEKLDVEPQAASVGVEIERTSRHGAAEVETRSARPTRFPVPPHPKRRSRGNGAGREDDGVGE